MLMWGAQQAHWRPRCGVISPTYPNPNPKHANSFEVNVVVILNAIGIREFYLNRYQRILVNFSCTFSNCSLYLS